MIKNLFSFLAITVIVLMIVNKDQFFEGKYWDEHKLVEDNIHLSTDEIFLTDIYINADLPAIKDPNVFHIGEHLSFGIDSSTGYHFLSLYNSGIVFPDSLYDAEAYQKIVTDHILVQDVLTLIEDRYDFQIRYEITNGNIRMCEHQAIIDNPYATQDCKLINTTSDLSSMTHVRALELMHEIGKFPADYLVHLDTLFLVGGFEVPWMAGFQFGNIIAVESEHIYHAVSHGIGHYIEEYYMQNDSTDWIKLNPDGSQTYTRERNTRRDTTFSGFVYEYGMTNWQEDIGTVFEVLKPSYLRKALSQGKSDATLRKKLEMVWGIKWDYQKMQPISTICNCEYGNKFDDHSLDFIPYLGNRTGTHMDVPFWKDLLQKNVISSPAEGWYWDRRL